MSGFNINRILFRLINNEIFLRKIIKKEPELIKNSVADFQSQMDGSKLNTKLPENNAIKLPLINNLNNFTNVERPLFIKNLLGLPPTLSQILQSCQNLNKPLTGGTLGIMNINQDMLNTNKILSDLFDEINSTNVVNATNLANINPNISQTKPDVVSLMFSGMVSMPDISKLILENSKQAVATLLLTMSSLSKQGADTKAVQETLSVLNSCINLAESDNASQNLKSLMLLYLPWLPLSENAGFDLEISMQDSESDLNDSKLIVLIQTKNFGNLKGVFTLSTTNSVDVYIICDDSFPKKILLEKMRNESDSHAMNTNIDIENVPQVYNVNDKQEAKVNLSATNELNPYLLLMAHAFIRYTIEIDIKSITSLAADSQS